MRLPFDAWFMINLRNQGGFAVNIVEWDTFFPTVCWMLWKRQCRFVMESGFIESSDIFTLCSLLTMDFARCNALVDDIRELLSRDWEVIIRKIPTGMNKVMDALAWLLRDGLMGVLLFNVPPIEVYTLSL
ncbi:hypothetical protein V6N12_053623 [Hibiscus sabdariffa]|uniref:RNase H type-1 domain-containing protein n=1 Tax=Hibiscus sabdariffa TaxID=183260 RepID=A0ABR2D853_9ROSI